MSRCLMAAMGHEEDADEIDIAAASFVLAETVLELRRTLRALNKSG